MRVPFQPITITGSWEYFLSEVGGNHSTVSYVIILMNILENVAIMLSYVFLIIYFDEFIRFQNYSS